MSETTDHDLLVKLVAKFDSFYEEFRRVSNGTGFPRCAERLAHLEAAEAEIETLHGRIDKANARFWWLLTFGIGQAAAFILLLVKGALHL